MHRKAAPFLLIIAILLTLPVLPTQAQVHPDGIIPTGTGVIALPSDVWQPPATKSPIPPSKTSTATVTVPVISTPVTKLKKPGLLFPVGGIVIGTTRPVFDWKNIPGATSYTIQVSTTSDFSTVLINTTRTDSSFQPSKALPRFISLYWRVRAHRGDKTSTWASTRFRIRRIINAYPVTVTVVDTDGDPRAGLNVYAFKGSRYTGYRNITNSNGKVLFSLPQGNYRFRANYNGAQYWSSDSNDCSVPGCTAAVVVVGLPLLFTVTVEPIVTTTPTRTPTPTKTLTTTTMTPFSSCSHLRVLNTSFSGDDFELLVLNENVAPAYLVDSWFSWDTWYAHIMHFNEAYFSGTLYYTTDHTTSPVQMPAPSIPLPAGTTAVWEADFDHAIFSGYHEARLTFSFPDGINCTVQGANIAYPPGTYTVVPTMTPTITRTPTPSFTPTHTPTICFDC